MKFLDLSISDFFRYAITGCQLYVLVLVSNIRFVKDNISDFPEKAIFYLSLGIIVFYIYRTFIYPVILRIIDKTINRAENVRAVVRRKYGEPTSWGEINDLWQYIVNKNEPLNIDKNRIWSHSIHVLYITSILSLISSILIFHDFKYYYFWLYIAGTIVCGVAATWSELNYQKRLYRNLIINADIDIDKVLEAYKTNKRAIIGEHNENIKNSKKA